MGNLNVCEKDYIYLFEAAETQCFLTIISLFIVVASFDCFFF